MGAYDLAEWSSLIPGNEPLLISLFLRLQLVFILGFMLTNVSVKRSPHERFLQVALAVGLLVAQLPPLEFFQNMRDPNQFQQFSLVVFSTMLMGTAWLVRRFRRAVNYLRLLLCLLAMSSTVAALILSSRAFSQFGLLPVVGYGVWIYLVTWGIAAWNLVRQMTRSRIV
jgi:hypothetical protein